MSEPQQITDAEYQAIVVLIWATLSRDGLVAVADLNQRIADLLNDRVEPHHVLDAVRKMAGLGQTQFVAAHFPGRESLQLVRLGNDALGSLAEMIIDKLASSEMTIDELFDSLEIRTDATQRIMLLIIQQMVQAHCVLPSEDLKIATDVGRVMLLRLDPDRN